MNVADKGYAYIIGTALGLDCMLVRQPAMVRTLPQANSRLLGSEVYCISLTPGLPTQRSRDFWVGLQTESCVCVCTQHLCLHKT